MCLSRFTGWRGIFHSVTPLMQLSFSCIVTLCNDLLLYSLRVSFQNSISTILIVGNDMQILDAFSDWDWDCFLEWNPLFRFGAHMGQKWFKNNKYPWFEKQLISGCFCCSHHINNQTSFLKSAWVSCTSEFAGKPEEEEAHVTSPFLCEQSTI